MKITLKNDVGVTKQLKLGFSWSTFFMGAIVAMFRGQWSEVAKWVFLNPVTFGVWGFIQCWTTNKKTIVGYLEKGYKPATEYDEKVLSEKEIIA